MKIVLGFALTIILSLLAYQAPSPSIEIVGIGPPETETKLSLIDPTEVFLTNMIPLDESDEAGQDSEPFLAVHPNGKLLIGAMYYGQSVAANKVSPLFLSNDNGKTWKLLWIVPPDQVGPQSYCFSGSGKALYGSVAASQGTQGVSVLYTTDPQNGEVMRNISDLSGSGYADQPFVQACACPIKQKANADNQETPTPPTPVDRIYVGQNYFGRELEAGKTASLRVSVDGGKHFRLLGLEARSTGSARQDGPSVRPSIAKDGTVYVAFFHWTTKIGENYSGDIVVTRDNAGAVGENSFRELIDPSDGLPGRIVAGGRIFLFGERLDEQRIGAPLSLAVDPNDSSTVYLAWTDFDRPLKGNVLHLKRSTDRGQTWSADLLTIPSATNPALAVSDDGAVGFLYQQLRVTQSGQRWETHFQKSPDGVGGWTDVTLATFPTGKPARVYDPYLGYKINLLSTGNNFYGVFSAPNFADLKYFPQGVEFQRNNKNGELLSRDGKHVSESIDPYFFLISSKSGISPASSATRASSATPNIGEAAYSPLVSMVGLIAAGIVALLLAGYSLLRTGRVTSGLGARITGEVTRTIDEKIHGPTLTNYKGYVTVRFFDSVRKPVTNIAPRERIDAIVTFDQQPIDSSSAEIDLREGEDKSEVIFTVAIDTSGFTVEPPHQNLVVPTVGSAEIHFTLLPLALTDESSIFVQVFQRTLLVQVLAAKLPMVKS
jgi:hypothetical protein